MSSIITRMLKQTCVYWPPAEMDSGGDGFDDYGQPVVTSPMELDCRWEDRAEEYIGADGTMLISRSVVFVSEDVEVGGILMLGELTDITDAVNIKENEGAWEIKSFSKVPNLKATLFVRTAFL